MKYSQVEVSYDANGGTLNPRSQACSTCRWFDPPGSEIEVGEMPEVKTECGIVECYPMPIVSNAWCSKWEAVPVYEPEPLEVVIVDAPPEMPETEDVAMEMSADRRKATISGRGLIDRVLSIFKNNTQEVERWAGFKALPGGYYFAPFTNNFEDREHETLSKASHERYVARVKAGLIDMPELWVYHIPGTAHGRAEYVGMTEHTVYAVGKFFQSPLGVAMSAAYSKMKPGTLSMSHGFFYPRWAKQGLVYTEYNSYEHSTLPPKAASNPFTPFVAIELGS